MRRPGRARKPVLPRPSSVWEPVRSRPRVLLEASDPARGWAEELQLREAGYDVAVCWGPDEKNRCPLVGSEDRPRAAVRNSAPNQMCQARLVRRSDCALVDGADAVVFALGVRDPEKRAILDGILAVREDLPVALELPQPMEASYPDLLERCERLRYPATSQRLLEVVARLLGGRVAP